MRAIGLSVAIMSLGLNGALAQGVAPPVVAHKKVISAQHAQHVPTWHVMPPTPQRPQPEWGFGSWLAAPFNAIGSGVGYVAAGVGNVVETPFIAAGQAWSNENCWRNMIDPRDGQQKLFYVCR